MPAIFTTVREQLGRLMGRAVEGRTLQQEHHDSVVDFITVADAIPAADWERPLAPGKWTRAQVAEHLRLTYEVISRELSGEAGLRVRTSWWLRLMLRLRVLPVILREGRIGEGALAPREIRPGPGPFSRGPLLAQLRATAEATEAILARRIDGSGAGITHHVFGRLSPATALRFATVHNVHHTRQLAGRDSATAGN